MLSDIMLDEEGQLALWNKTGAPPPNAMLWDKIAETDAFMKKLQKYYLNSPHKIHSAYYFANWSAVHKAYNNAVTKAVTGDRADIPQALAEGAKRVHEAAIK